MRFRNMQDKYKNAVMTIACEMLLYPQSFVSRKHWRKSNIRQSPPDAPREELSLFDQGGAAGLDKGGVVSTLESSERDSRFTTKCSFRRVNFGGKVVGDIV